MSIIYEALKKAEKSIQTGTTSDKPATISPQQSPEKPRIKLYILYALVACVGLFVGNAVFGFLSPNQKHPQLARQKSLPAPVSQATQPLPSSPAPAMEKADVAMPDNPVVGLALNGVFFTEGEGYALINNKIVKIGDEVGGAIIKKIDLDGVELEASGVTTRLPTQSK